MEDKIPPDFVVCENHLRATLVGDATGANPSKIDLQSMELIERKEFPLTCHRNELGFMGSGFPLYFEFIIFSIVILFTILGVSGIYNMITNYSGHDCLPIDTRAKFITETTCIKTFATTFSLANKQTEHGFLTVQHVLNLLTLIIIIITLQIFRRTQRINSWELDQRSTDASDYTAMFSKLPPATGKEDVDEQLKRYIEGLTIKNFKPKVAKINLGYDLKDYFAEEDKKNAQIKIKQTILGYRKKNNGQDPPGLSLADVEKKIKLHDENLNKLEDEFHSGVSNRFCGVAFVSFNTQKELQEVLKRYDIGIFKKITLLFKKDENFYYKGQRFVVEQAPEPSDVKWPNLGYKYCPTKFVRRLITAILTLLMLVLSFFGIIGLNAFVRFLESPPQGNTPPPVDTSSTGGKLLVRALAMLATCAIVIINKVIAFLMKFFADFELYSTQSHYNHSLATKLGFAQFTNTALITFFFAKFVSRDYWGKKGMVIAITDLFISNAWLTPFLTFVDFGYFFRLYQRYSTKKQGNDCLLTQEQANAIFEGIEFDIAQRYANIIKTMLFTAFYCPVVPLATLISACGLILTYWVDKYVLLRRAKEPPALSGELSMEMTEVLEYILPAFAIGNIVFEQFLLSSGEKGAGTDIISWVTFAVGIINAFLPMGWLNEKLFPTGEEQTTNETYNQARRNFEEEYDRENPATRDEAAKEYTAFMKGYQAANM
eukprot:TRINITY_DN9094_c0_g1_i9.p1 TRINITY_DN9094_c0_g1~~TRINITY_DN9094_c0_g1_i9.p1  ORF type:complete len:714 (-),score=160.72 TRINITY_DN9094_c0_g1_i9:100-2241(-)